MADDPSNRGEENMAAADDDAQYPTSSVDSTEGGNDLFNISNFREGLAKLVAAKQLSFGFGNSVCSVNLFKALNPLARGIPAKELHRTTILLYNKGKKDLGTLFANFNNKVSISCDLWSDHGENNSYISIMCHWIDDSWLMQKRLLAFRLFDEMYTPENLSQLIFLVLGEYNLTTKVYSISMNNALSNATNVEDLKLVCESSVIGSKFCHVVCVCHVLNLCVQDMLVDLAHHIKPIEQAIDCLFFNSQTSKEWAKFCKTNDMKPRRFMRYDPTRWNSAYILFKESFPCKELLCSFFMQKDYDVHLLPDHWVICEKIFDILKTFHEATFQLSRFYHPTAHLVLLNYCYVALVLTKHSSDENLKYCVEEMKRKWKKYFFDIPEINLIAIVLDPRIRLDGLQDLLTMYYDALIPVKDKDSPDPTAIVNNVKTCFHNIYNEYKLKHSRPANESQEANTSNPGLPKRLSLRERFKRFRASSELENYFDIMFEFDETDDEEFDILQWWSKRTGRFPILSVMAKEVLTCPASTVDVEEVFNMRGKILSERRSMLPYGTLDAQTCLRDWTNAKHRSQDLQEDSNEEGSDLDTDEEEPTSMGDTDHSE